jgi:hypothetical protein
MASRLVQLVILWAPFALAFLMVQSVAKVAGLASATELQDSSTQPGRVEAMELWWVEAVRRREPYPEREQEEPG